MNDDQNKLLREFERLVAEGGVDVSGHIELEHRYNCDRGFHKWKLYDGFREKYHFCELCDIKDTQFPILK